MTAAGTQAPASVAAWPPFLAMPPSKPRRLKRSSLRQVPLDLWSPTPSSHAAASIRPRWMSSPNPFGFEASYSHWLSGRIQKSRIDIQLWRASAGGEPRGLPGSTRSPHWSIR